MTTAETITRFWDDTLKGNEAADVDLRQSVLREMARDLLFNIEQGSFDSPTDALAQMLDQAFRSGVDVAQTDRSFSADDRIEREMTKMDAPLGSREALNRMIHAICGSFNPDNKRLDPSPHALIFVQVPTKTNDGAWRQVGHFTREYSHKAIAPLFELGLIKQIPGSAASCLTEWGYELVMTGKTSLPDSRWPRTSSTAHEWAALADEVGGALSHRMEEQPSPSIAPR
jgi:hypothetical protein